MKLLTIIVLLCAVQGASAQSWSNAQLLNDASEAGQDVKSAKVVAARNGGFHAVYAASQLRYKRYVNGVLHPRQTMPIGNFWANANFCETPDGKVHAVIEDWASGGPEVRWYSYSVNDANGQLFGGLTQVISASGGMAKHPHIAAFGLTGNNVVMSYFRAASSSSNKLLFWNFFNGSSWSTEASMNSWGNSEYEVFGIARSPLDGTVYRTFTDSGSLKMRRFRSGAWWDPEILIDNVVRNNQTMHNRQRVAVNSAGQVMVLWDQNDRYWSAIYTPGAGVSPAVLVTDRGSWGNSLCAIPNTNTFYTIYPKDNAQHTVGRRWANGMWGPEEEVANGLAWAFSVGPDVAAAEDGTLYAVWEYWASGKPQQYYSIKPPPAPGATGTVSGVVRDQFGRGIGGIGVNSSGAAAAITASDGSYTMNLPPGTYTLTAAKEYFTSHTVGSVSVTQNQTTTVNFVITGQLPAPLSAFSAQFGSQQNVLHWTNPTSVNFSATRIVAKTGGYPSGPDDGIVLVDHVAPLGATGSFLHAGLTNAVPWYYAAYAYMKEGNHYYASPLTATATPAIKPDMDHDGDVDQADFGMFQACYTGAFQPQNDPACLQARIDADDDVDGDDVALFLSCMAGPGVLADPDCP